MVYSSVISIIIDKNEELILQNLLLTGHFVLFLGVNIVMVLQRIQNFVAKLMQRRKRTLEFFFLKKKLCGVHPAKLINLLCVRRNTAIVS